MLIRNRDTKEEIATFGSYSSIDGNDRLMDGPGLPMCNSGGRDCSGSSSWNECARFAPAGHWTGKE